MKSTPAQAARFSHRIVSRFLAESARRFALAAIATTVLAAVYATGTAEDTPLPAAKMPAAEFNRKYEKYLLEDHVRYVSTGFGETLIPATREVLKENPALDPHSVALRILVADRLYEDFSPAQFDEVADFPLFPGPGGQSLNVWVKSLQKSTVLGDSLNIQKPLAWWPLYLGVSEAFDHESVLKWAQRESQGMTVSIREIVVKAIMKAAIRHRYRTSAAEVYQIICADYANWHDAPQDYDRRDVLTRLHKIVVGRLDKEHRDADLFDPGEEPGHHQ